MVKIEKCRSCGKPIVWGKTKLGKFCPYDVDESGKPTAKSHFSSCPQASVWSKKRGE